jgi:peptidyl-prolyl cis-trans isomerase C
MNIGISALHRASLAFLLLVLPAAVSADPSTILYQTDSVVVTQGDFEDYLIARGVDEKQRAQALSKPGAVRQIVDTIFMIKVMSARANANPEIDRSRIEIEVADHRARLLMRAQLDDEISEELADTDWDALAMDEYNANPDKYTRRETIRASHILVYSKDRSAEELEARVSEVMAALENGESFDEVAKAYSDDSGSAAKGGDLGFFSRGRMVPEFEAAAFALVDAGDMSEPVTSQFGVHIIKLTDRREAGPVPFEQAKLQIMPVLRGKVNARTRESVMQTVKQESVSGGIAVNEDALKQLEASFGATPADAAATP